MKVLPRLRWMLASLIVLLPLGGCGRAPDRAAGPASPKSPEEALFDRGEMAAMLYARHCAACHGATGDGQGIAADFLNPKPRDLRAGGFRLVSTENGVPSRDDLRGVLLRGMPGSSMPPWAHLPDDERELLVEAVLDLRRQGALDVERALAEEAGDELTEEELLEAIAIVTEPGPIHQVPDLGEPTRERIERGRELYLAKGCVSCHGPQGKGDGQQQMVDAEGYPTRPRDLTLGIFKGNADPESVYRRLALGMPGSPMPDSKNLAQGEIADLVHFVLSLSDDATRQATVPNRERLVAHRVGEVSHEPLDESWNGLPGVRLRTIPLWWRDAPDPWLEVRAAHDGRQLAVQLTWADERADWAALRMEQFQDAAAVQLYRGDAEPFIGMGADGTPVDVWMWGADRQHGSGDVERAYPDVVVDLYPLAETVVASAEYARPGTATEEQDPVSSPALATGNGVFPGGGKAAASDLQVNGFGTLRFRMPIDRAVEARGQWESGRWNVVFVRGLAPAKGADSVVLEVGGTASIGFAVWDGSQGDRNGQKRITIWQDLLLE